VLLINTYLKALRKEKVILKVNIFTLLISIVFSFISIKLMNNLDLAVLSIIILLAMRTLISEYILLKVISVNYALDFIVVNILVILFIYVTWNFKDLNSIFIYTLALILYVFIFKKKILISLVK